MIRSLLIAAVAALSTAGAASAQIAVSRRAHGGAA